MAATFLEMFISVVVFYMLGPQRASASYCYYSYYYSYYYCYYDSNYSVNGGIIAGAVIGGLVAIAVGITIVVIACKKQKRGQVLTLGNYGTTQVTTVNTVQPPPSTYYSQQNTPPPCYPGTYVTHAQPTMVSAPPAYGTNPAYPPGMAGVNPGFYPTTQVPAYNQPLPLGSTTPQTTAGGYNAPPPPSSQFCPPPVPPKYQYLKDEHRIRESALRISNIKSRGSPRNCDLGT